MAEWGQQQQIPSVSPSHSRGTAPHAHRPGPRARSWPNVCHSHQATADVVQWNSEERSSPLTQAIAHLDKRQAGGKNANAFFLHFFAYPGANGFLHILHFFAFFCIWFA